MASHDALKHKMNSACHKKRRPEPLVPAHRREPEPFGPIQTKLTVGPARGPFEAEADRIAEQVVRMQDSTVPSRLAPPAISRLPDRTVSRQPIEEEEEELQPKAESADVQRQPIEEEEGEEELLQPKATDGAGHIQRLCAECEEELQSKSDARRQDPGTSAVVGHRLEARVKGLRGVGQPLSAEERAFFEPRFGVDFAQVRLHTGRVAADTARSMRARAYTVGPNVVFAAGQYSSRTSRGRLLLAHELTHVVQQSRGSLGPPTQARGPSRGRGRCEEGTECGADSNVRHQGSGSTWCDRPSGTVRMTVTEHCAGDCVAQHEGQHARDLRSCCRRVKLCLDAASNAAERRRCNDAYQTWFDGNEHRDECRAYRREVRCLNAFIPANCRRRGGAGVSRACCRTLRRERRFARRQRRRHCRRAVHVACPFNASGGIR